SFYGDRRLCRFCRWNENLRRFPVGTACLRGRGIRHDFFAEDINNQPVWIAQCKTSHPVDCSNIEHNPHGQWFVLPNTNLLQQSRFDGPLFSVQSGIQPGREDVDEYTIGTLDLALVEMNLATEIDYNPYRILRFPVAKIIHSDGLLQRRTPEAIEVFFRCIFERCAGILPNQKSQGASCIIVV